MGAKCLAFESRACSILAFAGRGMFVPSSFLLFRLSLKAWVAC